MDLRKIVGEARRRGGQAVELLKEIAFELSWDVRDAAKTGFGVPKLVTSTASLGVATVAAAGTASVAFDLIGKVWGKKECATCNGWEGLRCDLCNGLGQLQYKIDESSLPEADRKNSHDMAAAALDGRAAVEFFPVSLRLKMPFPQTACHQCDGTGVMKCHTCNGSAWVPRFTIARTMNAPWLAWDAYRKILPPSQVTSEYDEIREKVATRQEGWQNLQEILILNDPLRAEEDPVIVTNKPYLKAAVKILQEVSNLPVPARPEDWMVDGSSRNMSFNAEKVFKESAWSKGDLKDPRIRSEMKFVLEEQDKYLNTLLDSTWETYWKEQKFEEIKREIIDSYEHEKEAPQQAADSKVKQSDVPVGPKSPSVSSSKKTKAVAEKKADVKKRPDDDRKKKERQERSERMGRQAAEREAALAKAKAAREQRGGQ